MKLQVRIMMYIFIIFLCFSATRQEIVPNIPTANISTTWNNSDESYFFASSTASMKAILVRPTPNPRMAYACGFFTSNFKSRYFFSVAILVSNDLNSFEPYAVWSANRNTPVYRNATFQLTSDGNMLLSNAESEPIWSTNIVGKSAAGMKLTESGQRLKPGQKLVACATNTNCRKGLYSYTENKDVFFLHIGAQLYHHKKRNKSHENGTMLQLVWDGHLRRFHLDAGWLNDGTDVLEGELNDCQYPIVCGKYGICQNGQCSCPHEHYFKEARERRPNRGCFHINPLDCNAQDLHGFVEVLHAEYFTFETDLNNTDRDTCKKACLANCYCKAAMFRYRLNSSIGECYLPKRIYSFLGINYDTENSYNLSIDLKVQTTPRIVSSSRRYHVPLILGFTSGALFVVAFVIYFTLIMIQKNDKVEENELDGLPTVFKRFSYKDIKIATRNFSINIGEGLFHGSLRDGTQIMVKHLDDSFLTQVRSICNIHHVNLVRLIGYCDEKSRKLVVYEYMANGSLEKWLGNCEGKILFLDWNYIKNIVIGIAKGLAYLHEDCTHKIIHLDVKPQNIMLDENFNAKLVDFGSSKLLSRDESKIFTALKVNHGYQAPEWSSSVVSNKVDVYSFGVVILDILCGWKVIDLFENGDRLHLLRVYARKVKEEKLQDMVEECSEDMQSIGKEVRTMLQIAAWCMQNEHLARPSMSYVVKVLEGIVHVDLTHLDYDFISRPDGF